MLTYMYFCAINYTVYVSHNLVYSFCIYISVTLKVLSICLECLFNNCCSINVLHAIALTVYRQQAVVHNSHSFLIKIICVHKDYCRNV